MGTDIELYVEHRGPAGWRRVPSERRWYDRRDSALFRLLRDCTDTMGGGGLPDDVSDEVRREAASPDCEHVEWSGDDGFLRVRPHPPCGCLAGGGHAHLTVRQLVRYDWARAEERWTDVADRDDGAFARGGRAAHLEELLNRTGTAVLPPWSGTGEPAAGAGPEWTAIDGLRDGGRPGSERTLVTWQQPAWRDVNAYWFATVLRMAHLAGDDLDSVRCVFWFT
jgi:hypothetical protein